MADAPPIRILIADDEAPQMQALCDTLREQGYATRGCGTGEAALAALRESPFDLLLTDLMMPGMDGIALLRAAREIDPHLIGIIMTGQGTISTAVEAMKTGAFDYMLKPFKLSIILPVLSRALAMRRLRLENAELAERVRERTAELEAANKELEAFSYSVSHDLRAPLRHIDGFSGLLVERHSAQLSPEGLRLLGRVTSSVRRMNQLIEDLLSFSRLGRQPLARQPVGTAALVREVVDELQGEHSGRSVEVRLGEMPDCVADPALLRQVFVNLLSNAFKFTRQREKPLVEVGGRTEKAQRIYFVRDNGAGFDAAHAEKLFGVFQRLHAQSEFEGTGVGLSIVQRIVQRHGGRVWAEAAVDRGATFWVSLPE